MDRDIMRRQLGMRIQQIREAKGETQQALADRLSVDRQVIKTWETGTRHIKAHDLIALADHFDCTIDFLVGRSDNPSRDKNIQEICDYTGLSQWSIEELHDCKTDPDQKTYIETVNALLENRGLFHEIAFNITRAAEAKTIWRLMADNGIDVRNPEIWNEANRALTIGNIVMKENSPYNLLELPDGKEIPVLLPTGSWFLSTNDAADFLVNRATEAFRNAILAHVEAWNVWPDLTFEKEASGKITVAINPNDEGADNGEYQED